MYDKAGIPGFFSNHSNRTAVPYPNFLRLEIYSSAATKPGYQYRKPWNAGKGHSVRVRMCFILASEPKLND